MIGERVIYDRLHKRLRAAVNFSPYACEDYIRTQDM